MNALVGHAKRTQIPPVANLDTRHVVIIGGGFAGLAAARTLRRKNVRVTLIDRANHHVFQPLLYQVATAALAAPDIAAPIRHLFRKDQNISVLMGDVVSIDPQSQSLQLLDPTHPSEALRQQRISYDALILAAGMTHAYFGHDEWAKHAPGLKTLGEALEIRSKMLRAFEEAEREPDPIKRRELTTFAIIGGGPTGVEMAGALAEIARRTLARDFRNFDPKGSRIVLIEAGPRLLAGFDPELSEEAARSLGKLGVEVRTSTRVTSIDEGAVGLGEETIRARTIIWAAGVRANPLTRMLGAQLDRMGRVEVNDDLSIPGHPHIFVVGDLISKQQDGAPLPGVAQVALQSGRHAAQNLLRSIAGEERKPFRYRDKGSMATIGRARAIAQIGKTKLHGFIAWVLWLFIHVLFLVSFRNRVAVMMEWFYAYVTWNRSSRVILEAPQRAPATPAPAPAATVAASDAAPLHQ